MGLITFLMLGAFSLLYISKTWENKPAFVQTAVDFLNRNLEMLAIVGLVYGLVAAILTPIMIYLPLDMFVRLIANVMIIVMALPYSFDKIATKYSGKMNSAVEKEGRNFVGWISANEKTVGIAGAVVTVLLFAVIFR